MCLPFSFQGRAKVSLKDNCEKIELDCKKILGYLGMFRNFEDI